MALVSAVNPDPYMVGGQNDNSEEYMTCDHGGADRQEHDQRVRMRSSQWSKVYSGHHSQGDEDPERKSPTSRCSGVIPEDRLIKWVWGNCKKGKSKERLEAYRCTQTRSAME